MEHVRIDNSSNGLPTYISLSQSLGMWNIFMYPRDSLKYLNYIIVGEKITLVIGELAVFVYDVDTNSLAASVDIPNHPIVAVNLGAECVRFLIIFSESLCPFGHDENNPWNF